MRKGLNIRSSAAEFLIFGLKSIFSDGELNEPSVIRDSRITASDGKSYHTNHYNPDAVISAGHRVNRSKECFEAHFSTHSHENSLDSQKNRSVRFAKANFWSI